MYDTVSENLLRIRKEIEPCKPRIIAITKYFPQQAIEKAYAAGIRDFGESRAIEACEKIEALPYEIRQNSIFHFIGHLQTNKVKHVVRVFEYIHSVDSLKLAQSISDHAKEIGKVQKILLQVNNANEEQKFGFFKEEIFENFAQIQALNGIETVGVMNIAPLGVSADVLEKLFSDIVQLKNELEIRFSCELNEVSMGMSQDYKIAAQCGSTMLRIGRKLFE